MSVRLLLIEDNPGDALIFREKLNESDLDYELVHTQRLSDALRLIEEQSYDLILCDLSLPDARGLEAVVQVRERAPDRPVIVLTGLDDATAAAQARHEGAVDYLVKWYVDGPSLARYIRYAITQFRIQPTQDGRTPHAPADAEDSPSPATPKKQARAARPPEATQRAPTRSNGESAEEVPAESGIEAALDASPDGVAVVRRDRRVLYLNARAKDWLGDARSYPWPVSAGERSVRRDGQEFVQRSAATRWGQQEGFIVTLREASPRIEVPSDTAPLTFATEAALSYLEVVERRSRWMGDILRSALDLHQHVARDVEVKREIVDLAELAAAAGKDHRQEALGRGLPLRVAAGRKKIIASTDRNVVCHLLRRMVVDALHTARSAGVELEVDVEGHTSVIRVTWDPPPDDPRGTMSAVEGLARDVAERLAERCGGRYEVHDLPGERTVTVRLPGREDVEV